MKKDFVHTHDEVAFETIRFIGNESRIPCSKGKDVKDLENYTGISLTQLLRTKDKNEIFEIVRDSIICPKELVNAEVHYYFTKVSWSERPLKLKPNNDGKFQYILGALDSHYVFRLFIKAPSAAEMDIEEGLLERDEWNLCVDFTESYRQLLISQVWTINVEDEANFSSSIFVEYKRRMYDLATVDFIWLPPWENMAGRPYKQATEGDFSTTLLTAHASGDVCLWNVCINYATGQHDIDQDTNKFEPNFYLTLEFRKTLVPGEIVSSLSFYKISSSVGVLVVGTTQGSVKAFRLFYNSVATLPLKPLPQDEGPPPQKYTMDEGLELCERDSIEVQTTRGVVLPPSEQGLVRVQLYVFRHPNFMIPLELAVPLSPEEAMVQEQSQAPERIVQGILTGCTLIPKDESADGVILMTLTQRGVLSWMDIQGGQVKEVSSTDLGMLEAAGTEEPGGSKGGSSSGGASSRKRLQFGGLAVSSNEAMICVSKTLAEYYNHLALRTPSVLQFHSMIPSKTAWSFVREKCAKNEFLFHRFPDVLSAFRVLMTTSDTYIKDILDWAVPLAEKSLQELQILFWVLRLQPHVDRDQLAFAFNLRKVQPGPFLELKCKQIRSIRRQYLVSDRIMQLRCWDIIKKVVETPEKYDLEGNVTNLQSLMIMYNYLETKPQLLASRGPLPLKPRVLVDPPPRKPACPLCGKPTKLLSAPPADRWKVNVDFFVEHPIDQEQLDGVLWHEQTHVQKSRLHPITNCVLSLVPTSFPYRKCSLCGTICMLHPTFTQDPLCPFCNGIMDPPLGFWDEEDEDPALLEETNLANNAELQKLVQEIKNQREKELRQKAEAAPISRRARIENMYIDS